MAIEFGKDGTVYCNTIRYNYKQTRNLIVNCDAELGSVGGIGWTRTNVDNKVVMPSNSFHAQYGMKLNNEGRATAQIPVLISEHKYYFQCKIRGSSDNIEIYATTTQLLSQQPFLYATEYDTGNNWVKVSGIFDGYKGNSAVEQISIICIGNASLYSTRHILIDLTDTFGAGQKRGVTTIF